MIIKHNMSALNANRMFGLTTEQHAKNTEKLASGYRINRGADDAAGLSISEKIRRQIRGLSQASANASDGISCVQAAEGALNEIHEMLQRINELAVKGENGTIASTDRTYIQKEVQQLMKEIDRIALTTTFNEKKLLDGSFTGVGMQVGAEAGEHITITISCMSVNELLMEASCAPAEEFETKHVDSFYIKSGSQQKYADGDENVFEAGMLFRFYEFDADKVVGDYTGKNVNLGGAEDDGLAPGSSDFAALNAFAKSAMQTVSRRRSELGAAQIRLEHTILNLDNVVENATASESRIRDTNMAADLVKYYNNRILLRSGQAVLAQAKQSKIGVFALLR